MITLQEAKVGMVNKIDQAVVDEFRRGSFLLDKMTFDDCISPGTGGSNLVYGYQRIITPAAVDFRAINTEYTAQEAKREDKTAKLSIFGGKFSLDRVIIQTSNKKNDELRFQLQEKIKAAVNHFHYFVINGDVAVQSNGFDGLNKALKSSSTEVNGNSVIDISTQANINDNGLAFIELLDSLLSELDGKPDMLLVNGKLKVKINSVARKYGYYTRAEDAFGKPVDGFAGVPLVDVGYYVNGGSTVPAIKIEDRNVGGSQTGLTDIYAVRLGLDAFHGASVNGDKMIRTYLPDLSAPGAVKSGEVEFLATPVLKSTRGAGVLRNIKIK